MKVKILLKSRTEFLYFILVLFQILRHLVNPVFNLYPFCAFFWNAMIQMKITLFFITCIQFVPYCLSVNSIFIDIVYPLIFECPFIFQDQFIHKGRHPFHHDNKTIPTFIHILYVLTAEISPVQNESDLLITISGCFIQHELKLGDIVQTSWIFFIK